MDSNAWQEFERIAPRILGRELITVPYQQLRRVVAGKRVLVSGAGGYIGSALVRLLTKLDPARIVLCDNGEYALYRIDRELKAVATDTAVDTVLCDVRDRIALDRLCQRTRPEIVFHAAALKQLPLTEGNVREAVLTNVIGTSNMVESCRAAGARAFIHISSDKAAAPSSILGMTKRVAEQVCQAADSCLGMRISSVRFNNVFGSTGSVVPLFLDQIAGGGALTITDPAMNRYFVTGGEAAQLVIAALGMTLEPGTPHQPLYLLESGSPLAIVELARRLCVMATGNPDPEFEFVGIRNGEKLDESLIAPWEGRSPTAMAQVDQALTDRIDRHELALVLKQMQQASDQFDEDELRSLVARCCSEPVESGAFAQVFAQA